MFGKKRFKSVRVQEFILEDENGAERAAIRMDSANNVLISFRDENGSTRFFAGLTNQGTPRLCLSYAGGKGSIQLEANDSLNSAAMVVSGPSGKAQVLLGVSQAGLPAIGLFDENGRLLFPGMTSEPPAQAEGTGFDWDSLLRY